LSALARHVGVARLKLVENFIGVMRPASLDVGQAALDGGVKGCQPALALLKQTQRITNDFARVVVTPAGELTLNERLEMAPECVAAPSV
jgi:hypothetical protein